MLFRCCRAPLGVLDLLYNLLGVLLDLLARAGKHIGDKQYRRVTPIMRQYGGHRKAPPA